MSVAAVREEVRAASPAESYALLRSLEELGEVLLETLAAGFRLDAYLVAAGMLQIVQDELHPDPLRLDETAKYLRSQGNPLAGVVGACAQVAQRLRRPSRELRRCERELAALVEELAALEPVSPARAAAVVESLERLPARVREAVLRLPACFHDFDQRPEDLAALARRFAERFPDRSRRLVVVGVRTSGSYLAPLQAECLRREGFERVAVLTVRPGRRLHRHEGRLLRESELALVVDDPPGTGGSLVRVIRSLRRPVVLLLQLFEGQELPPALAGYDAVCLPWTEWAVHARLDGEQLPAGRGHAQARCRDVIESGVGLGYFGGVAAAVARALPDYLPEVEIEDGVLRREWLPDEAREAAPEVIARYVAARAAALPVREDFSLRLTGEHPAWEVAANVLSRAFGRAGPAVKLLGVDAAARRLLRVQRPSLVDGWTDARQWFAGPLTVGFHERSYWHLGLACFDPAFDLAGAAAGRDDAFAETLLRAYPDEVDPERFLLYELAHLWCRGRLHPEDGRAVRSAQSAAVRRYVARRFPARVAADGPVCALDVDGVLETEHLGFPSTTRSGALALQALIRHGYRPVLATGRSAAEVAERCAGYGLPGGVAEYGGALVVGGEIRSLLDPEMANAVERVRRELSGAELDPRYHFSVRAFGLREDAIERALAVGHVRAIRGDGQVDFVPVGVDKASGLAELIAELGAGGLAFAVGDTLADLPMLQVAERAAAPGHAGPALRRYRVRRPYQAGLLEAVERLLGERIDERLDDRAELLLTMLSAQERGPRGILAAAARVWRAV